MLLDIDYNAQIKIGPSGEFSNKIKSVYKIIEPNLVFSKAVLEAFAKWIELEIPWDLQEYAFRFGKKVSKPKYFSYYVTLIDDWWNKRNIRSVEDAIEFTYSMERQKEREKIEAKYAEKQKNDSGRPAQILNTYFPEKIPGREFIESLSDEGEDGTRIALTGGHDYLLKGVSMDDAKKIIYSDIDAAKPFRIAGLYVPTKIPGMENYVCLMDQGNDEVDVCLLARFSFRLSGMSLEAAATYIFGKPHAEKHVAKAVKVGNVYVPVRTNGSTPVCIISTEEKGIIMGTVNGNALPIKGRTFDEAITEYEAHSEVKPAPIAPVTAPPKAAAVSPDEITYRKLEEAHKRLNNPEWKNKKLTGSTKPEGYANQMKGVNNRWNSAVNTLEPMYEFFKENRQSETPKPLKELRYKNLSAEAVLDITNHLLDFYNSQDNVSPILGEENDCTPHDLWTRGYEYMKKYK